MAGKDRAEEVAQMLDTIKTGGDMKAIVQYFYNSMMSWTTKESVNGIEWNSEEVSKVINGICQHFEMEDHHHKRSYLSQNHTIQDNTKPMSVDEIVLQLARKTYRQDKNLDNAINRYLQLIKKNQNKKREEHGGENKHKKSLHHGNNGSHHDHNPNDTTIVQKKEKNKKRSRSEMEQDLNTPSISTTSTTASTKKKKKETKNGHDHSNGHLPHSKKVKTNNHNDNKTHDQKLLADIYAGESEDDSMDEDKNIPISNRRETEKKEKKKEKHNNKEMGKQKNGTNHFNKGDAKLFEILKSIKNGSKVDGRGNVQRRRDEEEEEEEEKE